MQLIFLLAFANAASRTEVNRAISIIEKRGDRLTGKLRGHGVLLGNEDMLVIGLYFVPQEDMGEPFLSFVIVQKENGRFPNMGYCVFDFNRDGVVDRGGVCNTEGVQYATSTTYVNWPPGTPESGIANRAMWQAYLDDSITLLKQTHASTSK